VTKDRTEKPAIITRMAECLHHGERLVASADVAIMICSFNSSWYACTAGIRVTAVTDAARPPLMGCEGTGRRDETLPIWADIEHNRPEEIWRSRRGLELRPSRRRLPRCIAPPVAKDDEKRGADKVQAHAAGGQRSPRGLGSGSTMSYFNRFTCACKEISVCVDIVLEQIYTLLDPLTEVNRFTGGPGSARACRGAGINSGFQAFQPANRLRRRYLCLDVQRNSRRCWHFCLSE